MEDRQDPTTGFYVMHYYTAIFGDCTAVLLLLKRNKKRDRGSNV